MTNTEIYGHIDHTILKPTATYEEIRKLCDEAISYNMASVCIPPAYVARVHKAYGDTLNICTVIGFPLGYNTTAVKVAETLQAVEDGANEVDMVINVTDVKNGDFNKIKEEIAAIRKAAGNHILKVIVETCYLTDEEKIRLCGIITETGADFIKTSTGFGTAGADHKDVALFSRHIGKKVRMKASGGIRTLEDLKQFLDEGCDRIGTSSAITMLKEHL